MAIDTRDRRASAACVLASWRLLLPSPGTIDQGDRQQLATFYRGLDVSAPFVPAGVFGQGFRSARILSAEFGQGTRSSPIRADVFGAGSYPMAGVGFEFGQGSNSYRILPSGVIQGQPQPTGTYFDLLGVL